MLFALVTPRASAAPVLLDNTEGLTKSPGIFGSSVAGSAGVASVFSAAAALDLTSVAVGSFSGGLSPGQGVFALYRVAGSNDPTGPAIATVTTTASTCRANARRRPPKPAPLVLFGIALAGTLGLCHRRRGMSPGARR